MEPAPFAGIEDGMTLIDAAFLRKAAILVTMQDAGTLGPEDNQYVI